MTDMKSPHCSRCSMKWNLSILAPLWDFLRERHPEGPTARTVATHLGVTPQSVSAMFRADNTHLRKAEEIFRKYGYRLSLSFDYSGDYPHPEMVVSVPPELGNLAGLEEHRQRMGWTVNRMAAVAGIKRDTLAKAFAKGDMTLDSLVDTCNGLNLKVKWNWNPIED